MRPNDVPPVMSKCFDEERATIAAVVDHVVPHHGDPVLMWSESNWQALCSACHMRKTAAGL
jgi:5-methylcytosine-specific restriction protein A